MDTFGTSSYDRSLARGARAAVFDVLALRKDERVLIVTNPDPEVRQISMALFDAALGVGAKPVLMFQKEKGQFDFAEDAVIKSIESGPEVALSLSTEKLGKDRWGLKQPYRGKRKYDHIYDYMYEEAKFRGFWSPGITKDMFSRTVPIDYTRLRTDCARIVTTLSEADSVRVTAPGGTDITIGVRGRKHKPDDGDFRRPGRAGNLPSGEVYSSPVVGTSNGVIAFDGSIVLDVGEIVIKTPIVAEVEKGLVTSICGGNEARKLEKTVNLGASKARKMGKSGELKPSVAERYARNARSIGELGIGLNRSARIVANMLEDEKVYGTCHFALGSNYDGDAEALIHLDGLVKRPTITAVGRSGLEKRLMVDGKLVWD
ncbi:MAG: hypothetical protein A3K67_04205 [Euryarchaeota archaeon RBG_16_62_10]|nr:MAG: hypothetical protein A3K67_04205 [Euryarchaeota archaeon RBG_16_62_10]